MSRIYQGGQSESSYKARDKRKGYNPVQALSNQQAIIQEGQSQMRDLKTQEREAQRSNSMSDLERQSSDKVEVSQLEMQQLEASQILKQQQLVQKAELETAELAAKAALSMRHTTEMGQVSVEQLADKNVLKLNEFRQDAKLKLAQMLDSNTLKQSQDLESGLLKLDQTTQSNAQKLSQQGDKLGLEYVNNADSDSLRLQHAEESYLLKSEHAGQNADMKLATTAMQLGQQVDRANTQLLSTTISSLIDFGSTVATEVAEKHKVAEAERVKALSWKNVIGSGSISSSGTVDPAITNEVNLRAVENAEGAAIEQVAPGDYKTQERLRQPGADAAMFRSASVGQLTSRALTLKSRLNDKRLDPNTKVYNGAGQLVPITSLRSEEEYENGLYQIMQQFSFDDGLSVGSSYAAKKAWGPKALAAVDEVMASHAGTIQSNNQNQRTNVYTDTAASLMQAEDFQAAFDHAWSGSLTLGKDAGKGKLERGKGVVNMLMANTNDLDSVGDIRLESGGTIKDHPTYGKMLVAEQKSRFDSRNDVDEMASAQANLQVTETIKSMENQLIQAGPDGDVGAIKEATAAQLKSFGTAEATDKANELLKGDYRVSQSLYQSYLDKFAKNDPPNMSEVIQDFTEGRLSPDMFNRLKTMGEFGDQIDQRITASGVPTAEKMAGEIVGEATALISSKAMGDSASNIEQTNTLITNSLAPEIDQKLRAFAIANPKATAQDFLIEGNRIQNEIRGRLQPTEHDKGELRWTAKGGFEYTGLGREVTIQSTKGVDGSTINFYDNVNVSDIPKSAKITDRYFTQEEAQTAGSLYMAATPNDGYSPRTRAIAKKLGEHPSAFVRKQLQNMGYTMSTDFNSTAAVQGGKAIDPAVMDGLNVIGKYESDSVGGYNAVNQRGINGGRGVDGYSGHYSKLGGKDLTSLTLGEIMELQAPRPGMSNEQWKAEGRLHAVGRYQFIGRTLRGTAEAIGISPSEKFTPELQDRMGAWLLSEYGLGQWVGPSDRVLPHELVLVQNARRKLQAARVILSNPNSGNLQRARAMRTVGNPFG